MNLFVIAHRTTLEGQNASLLRCCQSGFNPFMPMVPFQRATPTLTVNREIAWALMG